MFNNIFIAYGLLPETCEIYALGSGLINHTWRVISGDQQYVMQQINGNVFQSPQDIAENLEKLDQFFKVTYPDYLFVAPAVTTSGDTLIKTEDGKFFRLFPFIKGSHTVDSINNADEAYEAAKQFGKFTHLLSEFDVSLLKITIPDFHNLSLRFDQFKAACNTAGAERMDAARDCIDEITRHAYIVNTHKALTTNGLPIRVIHHDTKINNVLFDENGKGICVIDLDTVMPGFFISDVGDMMRTYLSPANEEEKDFSKITIRTELFWAVYRGYMEQMSNTLTAIEKANFIFAGKFMIYMQAIRFLTDYLNNDIYYHANYPGHNLVRAGNQIDLLNKFIDKETELTGLINDNSWLLAKTVS